MRLIDADVFTEEVFKMQKLNSLVSLTKEDLLDSSVNNYDNGQKQTFELIIERLAKQPAGFDLESAIQQLEERKEYIMKEFVLAEKSRRVKDVSIARINEIDGFLEILKSAANATNVKFGGNYE